MVALEAIEELRKARIEREDITHIFICPHLFTAGWRRQLYKVTDMVTELPTGALATWGANQHEPLIIVFVFPFYPTDPGKLRNSPNNWECQGN